MTPAAAGFDPFGWTSKPARLGMHPAGRRSEPVASGFQPMASGMAVLRLKRPPGRQNSGWGRLGRLMAGVGCDTADESTDPAQAGSQS